MGTKESLRVGAKIKHFEYGLGTITSVGDDYIRVKLADGKHGFFRKDDLASSEPETDTAADKPVLQRTWPDNTFIWETEDQLKEHSLGSHWRPFYEDSYHITDTLAELIPLMSLHQGFGNFYPAPGKIPQEWPHGAHLCWPNPNCGLVMTILVEKNAGSMASLYPQNSAGMEVSIEIKQIFVWHGGLEAQIEGKWGDTEIAFFDTAFLINRGWYAAGETCQFILSGIAYTAKPAEINELRVSQPRELTSGLQEVMAEEKGIEPPTIEELETFNLEDSALLFPITEWDRDDYWFRGRVCEVSQFDNWLGQSGWKARVTVHRFGKSQEKDANLDVFITERSWSGSKPPEVGQDIEGDIWLQGRLWSAHAWKT